MVDVQKPADLETLARMAARLAGRDPDEHVRMALGDVVAFDDVMWRYFLARAGAAYAILAGPFTYPSLMRPGNIPFGPIADILAKSTQSPSGVQCDVRSEDENVSSAAHARRCGYARYSPTRLRY